METHSIQFKFLTTVISAMLAITVFIGGLAIYEVDIFVQDQAKNYINVMCEKEVSQINDIFLDMEKSVKIIESYVLDQIEGTADVQNRDKRNEVIKSTDKMFAEVAKQTDSVIAYYLRFAPELSDNKTGLFYSKTNGSDDYMCFEPTDLYIYDKSDVERVGWFWEPYEAGRPVWMQPYYNKNNDVFMISYVVPLYCENEFIGIVGMDFDYTVLIDRIREIKIYENGFAHLENNGKIIYLGDSKLESYLSDVSADYLQVSEKLVNGMSLVLSVNYDDVRQIRYDIAYKILFVVAILAALFSLIVFLVVRRIVKPLNKLTEASKELAKGNYNVEILHSNTYEIGVLGAAFENMAMHLREHKKLQHLLAFRDTLTGLRNTTSYNSWVADFNKEIQEGNVNFGVVVLDVNYLKETNDRYGHDVGNKLIVAVARAISDTFRRSPVFRIGGDEFLVLLQGKDLEEREELFAKFDLRCADEYIETDEEYIAVSIAKGLALYTPSVDKQFSDVFNRADDEMYKNKRSMKVEQDQPKCRPKRNIVSPSEYLL